MERMNDRVEILLLKVKLKNKRKQEEANPKFVEVKMKKKATFYS